MKQAKFLLLTLLALLGITPPIAAATESPYNVDFNSTISTSKPITVAKNWKHIVGSATYSYGSNTGVTGVEGDGALLVYGQNGGNDVLVTPLVNGTVTLQVKRGISSSSSNPAFVEFYAVDNDGTTLGELLQEQTSLGYYGDEGNADWQTVSVTVNSEQRIGIRGQHVYFDNFTAESATIVDEAKLAIASAVPSDVNGTIYWEQQANGKVLVSYTVKVTNTGDLTLTTGDANYSVTIVNATTNEDVATVNVPYTLAAGETSDEFTVSAEVETSLWPDSYTFNIFNLRENITNTEVERAQSHYTEYTPKFLFLTKGTSIYSSTSSIDEEQKFGTITADVTKNYQISNNGIAPLTIQSITLPAGFTTDAPTAPFTIVRKDADGTIHSEEFGITLPSTTKGSYSGNLEIVYLDKNGNEQTYTLALSGKVIGANTFSAEFGTTSLQIPEGSVLESTTLYGKYTGSNSAADGFLFSYNRRDHNKFITPKLHAEAGDQLTFDALKSTNDVSGSGHYIKVYISKDRSIWGTEYSSDGNPEWGTAVKTVDISELTSNLTRYNYAIDFTEAGDYYVAFEVYGVGLDNVMGLEKTTLPVHDLYVKDYTLPSEVEVNAAITPKATIIPLTNETASNYTVKYYVGTEAVATGTSTALTRSLTTSTSKDFSLSYTPTTAGTYDSYIAFEFTDGTTIETPHQQLKVKPGTPEFHFLASGTWVGKWSSPSNLSTDQDYGIVNTADGTKTFYLFNWGSAPLKVKSVTVPDGFTTNFPTEGVTIAAYDKTTQGNTGTAAFESAYPFDITFSTTTPGSYEGTVSVTYVGYDDDFNEVDAVWASTFVLKGTMLDPNKWYTNIGTDNDKLPAGSLVQANVSSTTKVTGDASLVSSSATKNLFITPKLKGEANEVLTFDAMLRSSFYDGNIKVYLVEDHVAAANTTTDAEFEALNPTLIDEITISKSTGSDSKYTNYSVTIPSAGEYYIAFKIEDARVDNIYGLKLADVAHEWILKDANIPTTAMQNISKSATVNIQNIGLQAETDYTVVAYVNGVATEAAGTTTIPVVNKLTATPTAVEVSFKSGKAGTFPVYFVIKADDYNVQTEAVDVTFEEEVASADAIQVGTKTGYTSNYSNSTIVDWYNADGSGTAYTDVVYSAAKLAAAGIKAGDKITTITFKHTSSKKSIKANVTSWVALSTSDSFSAGAPDKSAMQEISVYDGSTVDFPANFELALNLSEPIVYDGTSDIRIYTETVRQGSGQYLSVTTDVDSEIAIYYNSTSTTRQAPLAYFTLAAEPATFTGTVTDFDGNAIEGATVTLTSNDGDNIQYSGETDATGAFSINVIQSSREYDGTVEATGYYTQTAEGLDITAAADIKLPKAITITIPAHGSTSYSNADLAVDFSEVEGLNSYKVTTAEASADYITLTDLDEAAAGEGVILMGDAGTYTVPQGKKATADTDNLLVGVAADKTVDASEVGHIFRYVITTDGTSTVGFQKATAGQTISAGKAYLYLENASAKSFLGIVIGEGGTATAIEAIDPSTADRMAIDTNAPMYNLSGQRVGKDYKGVVIQNGKKFVVK